MATIDISIQFANSVHLGKKKCLITVIMLRENSLFTAQLTTEALWCESEGLKANEL